MSLNTYDKTTGKLIPAAGIPYETLNSKANNTVISSSSTAEATTTATKAHTAGDYFELNGAFVKAKTDIAIGDTLVEGTNYETTNVGSELSSMKSNFQAGCNTIVQAVTAMGSTPASNSPSDIATAIGNIETGSPKYTINITTEISDLYGEDVTATYTDDGNTVEITSTFSNNGEASFEIFEYTGSVTVASGTKSYTVTIVSGTDTYSVEFANSIYGVSWAGGTDTSMTRTDKSASFSNPSPAVNNGNGSSPFDNLYPWNGMGIVDDSTGGKLVSIPKYYYKWTKTGTAMTLQIADKPTEGFHTSPAHADRGDGSGERDVVYVGRYHCASDYKSTTGVRPQASVTRADFRTNIHNLGNTYWQYDFAMYWTIMMLYLVEYADWNSQKVIGYGCGDSSSKQNGLTDSMTYHTGTNAANRTTYGHTQYRHIEDLWGNVYDWCDGIYFSRANVYCIKNPANFSDSSGGTLVGTRPTSSGYISAWDVPTASGFEYALYPSAVNGDETTYIGDYCKYYPSGVVLYVGGFYNSKSQSYGAFYLYGYESASSSLAGVGGRLQKLP